MSLPGECILLPFILGFWLYFCPVTHKYSLYVSSSSSSSQGYKLKFNFIKIVSNHSLALISNDSVQGDPACSHNCNSIGLTSSCSQIAWAALSSQIYGISSVQRLNYSCRFDQGLHYSASNPCILTAAGGEHCCFTGTVHCSSALCQGLNCLWNRGTVSPKLQANNKLKMTWCINNKHGDSQKPALLLLHSPKLLERWLTADCALASSDAIWIYWCSLNILKLSEYIVEMRLPAFTQNEECWYSLVAESHLNTD